MLSTEEFIHRIGPQTLPLDAQGEINTGQIGAALADAAALIQSRLGGTVDLRQDVLKPLQSDIAYYRLTDRISSDEDARERYREALKLLDTIAQQEGPPEETITPQADLIDHPARFQKGIL